MSLEESKVSLEKAILQAFTKSIQEGSQEGSSPESNIQKLATSIASAIHEYVKSASVDISSVKTAVPPGTAVATTGTSTAQAGTTVTPAVAVHEGFGKLV